MAFRLMIDFETEEDLLAFYDFMDQVDTALFVATAEDILRSTQMEATVIIRGEDSRSEEQLFNG